MIPNPIRKVLSTLCIHDVRYLLMGGQACVLYGAAEFSRDCDIAVLCDAENLVRLSAALSELKAEPIAVPPFQREFLERGHAVHFRCQSSEALDIRVDVMARMRNVDSFAELWQRRETLVDETDSRIELLAIDDLVGAKKTQRDKDWPMIRRLVEAHYATHCDEANDEQLRFWLREARTPELLLHLAARHQALSEELAAARPLLQFAIANDRSMLESQLLAEQEFERQADREYWYPLKRELEELRRQRR